MRYAVCNELLRDLPREEGLRLAASFGYQALEVAPFTLATYADQISPEMRREYREAAERHGLPILGLHWLLAKTEGFHLTRPDRAIRQKTADYLGTLAKLCKDLGGNLMVLGSPAQRNFGPDQSHNQAMDCAIETLRWAIPALEKYQVQIAIEPLGPGEGNFLNHASQARQIIQQINSPWIRLHLDVKAMSSEGVPIDQVIRDHADLMIHFHANDPNLLGPGMGEVDFVPIVAALKEVNYSGWVSLEVFDETPGVETILRESIQNLRRADAAS
jgi:sugar phosphate isomerase/epimerase